HRRCRCKPGWAIPSSISCSKCLGTLALRSNIAVLGTALFALIVGHAHAQDAMTVAVGGRGIGESCVTEIGWHAGIFARHRLKLDIVYTEGREFKSLTRQQCNQRLN